MVLEEEIKLKFTAEGDEQVKKLISNINKSTDTNNQQLKVSNSLNNEELEINEHLLRQTKRKVKYLNEVNKLRGDETKATMTLSEETGELGIEFDETSAKVDRHKGKMDNLIKRYRWMQSFFLVTQNFVGMIGKEVVVFGGAMKMITAPLILFLNLALLPVLPYLRDFMTLMMKGVKWFREWQKKNELLADAIGIGLFGAILGLLGLPIVAWIGGLISGEGSFGFLKIVVGRLTGAIGPTATTGLSGAFNVLGGVLGGIALGTFGIWILDQLEVFEKLDEVGKNFRDTLDSIFGGDMVKKIQSFISDSQLGDFIRMISPLFEFATGGKKINIPDAKTGIDSILTHLGNTNPAAKPLSYAYSALKEPLSQSMSQVYNISMSSSANDYSGLQSDIDRKTALATQGGGIL